MESGGVASAQLLLNVAFAVSMAAVGWIMRSISKNLEDLRRADEKQANDLNNVRIELPSQYAAKADLRELTDALFRKLDRIEQKLDGKVDKD